MRPGAEARSRGGASGALPGSVHDLKAARIRGIRCALARTGLPEPADKGCIGTGRPVLTPYKGRGKSEVLKEAKWAHAPAAAARPSGPSPS